MIPNTKILRPLFLGFLFQFHLLSLYRAIQTKFPLDLVAVLMILAPILAFGFGVLADEARTSSPLRRGLWAASVLVYVFALSSGYSTNLHFFVSRIYYPYPQPSQGAFRVALWVVAWLASTPCFFGLGRALACPASDGAGWNRRLSAVSLGMVAAFPIAYAAARTLNPYTATALAASITLMLTLPRGLAAATVALCACVHFTPLLLQQEQLFAWRIQDYRKLETVWSPFYRLSFISFKENECLGGVFNQLMIWYACKDYDSMPLESRQTSEAFTRGRRRILSLGRTDGMTAMAALHANPNAEKITIVEIDPTAVERSRDTYPDYGNQVLQDPRVRVVASDWRHFLETDTEQYDLVYLDGLGIRLYTEPLTTIPQENFLYSRESFETIFSKRLAPGGLVTANWGSTRKEELFDIVANLPEGVHRAGFWATISTYPFTGLGLFFSLASRDADALNRVADEIRKAGSFKEIPIPDHLDDHAFTDDRPFLQRGLQPMLLAPSIPLVLLVLAVGWRRIRRRASDLPPGRPLAFGLCLGLIEAWVVSDSARRFFAGPALGWVVVGASFWSGAALAHALAARWSRLIHPGVVLPTLLLGLFGGMYLPTLPYGPGAALVTGMAAHLTFASILSGARAPHLIFAFRTLGYAAGLYLFQWLTYLVGFKGTAIATLAVFACLSIRRATQGDRRGSPTTI